MKPLTLLAALLLLACEDIEHFTDPPKREPPKEIEFPPQDSTPPELPPPPPHPGDTLRYGHR
jgi:hypothetical protein